jgi:formylglycine-generating enzyme required for sulfatase activity
MEVNGHAVAGPFSKSLADSLRARDAAQAGSVEVGMVFAGRYRCKEALGDHGPLLLWLAEDEQKQKQHVVLKIFPAAFSGDAAEASALQAALLPVRALKHPHLVAVLDVVQDHGRLAVVTEDVLGKSLHQIQDEKEGGCFDHTEIKPWIGQLCDVLQHAHAAGVAHQDVRPAQIILDEQGNLRLADFVLARTAAEWGRRHGWDLPNTDLMYRSPQALEGTPGAADDIYGVGVLVYELLAGRLPFSGINPQRQIKEVAPPAVTGARVASGCEGKPVPPKWEAAVARCLEKQPEKRPRSARDLALALGVGRGNAAVAGAGPASLGEKWRRLAMAAGGALGAVLLLAFTVGLCFWFFRVVMPEREAKARAQQEERAAAAAKAAEEERARQEAEAAREREAADAAAAAAREQESAARARAEAERLANARGGLKIRTDPTGATLRIAGLEAKTPVDGLQVPIGKQMLVVELAGHHPLSREVVVEDGQTADLGTLRLERQMGRVLLKSSPPGATVVWKGANAGTTPLELAEVPVGRVWFEFFLPGYYAATVEASIVPDRVSEVNALLSPTPGPRPGKSFTNELNMVMVWVDGVQAWVAKTETTQDQFQRLMKANPSAFAGPQRPVDNVTWKEAEEFCLRLTRAGRSRGFLPANLAYRLPTSAEWEKFAAGSAMPTGRGEGGGESGTLPAGSTPANPAGLHEVRGNVWEWCADPYQGNPGLRVLRGGSWMNHGNTGVRAPDLDFNGINDRGNHRGFRVVLKFDMPE